MKNAFYYMLKLIFVLKILTFSSRFFCHLGARHDKKANVDFKNYDVTDWEKNNYNTHVAQYLKKLR